MAKCIITVRRILKNKEGANVGWPYYYYDQMQGKKVLNPEYGGDGKKEGNGSQIRATPVGFPRSLGT